MGETQTLNKGNTTKDIRTKTGANTRPYKITLAECTQQNIVQRVHLMKKECHMIMYLFSGKLCNETWYFYSSVVISSSLVKQAAVLRTSLSSAEKSFYQQIKEESLKV